MWAVGGTAIRASHCIWGHMTESEWYTEAVEFVDGFMEWAGEEEIIRQALMIMWMGWRTRDVDILASLTGYDAATITYFIGRATSYNIWVNDDKMNANDWFLTIDGGSAQNEHACMIAVLLDAMSIAGNVDIEESEEGRIYVSSNNITGVCIVQNNSRRGSYFQVANVRMVDGQRQIRLRKSGGPICSGGPWKPASGYVIKGYRK